MSNLINSEKEIKLKIVYHCPVCGCEIIRPILENEIIRIDTIRCGCGCGYGILCFKVVL